MAIMMLRDLRPKLGPARNQGSRPTCIAFAFSDGHAAVRKSNDQMSVEHLYFNAVQRMPGRNPAEGVSMPVCIAALAGEGQCHEAGWPYVEAISAGEFRTPPATATPVFRRRSDILSTSTMAIVDELEAERPVVVALLLGERFYVPDDAGRVTPGSGDADTDYHAVLAVGHGRDGADPYILVRNSWGAEWGFEGHSWVSTDYLRPRLYALTRFSEKEMAL